jgi:hypothetical protein
MVRDNVSWRSTQDSSFESVIENSNPLWNATAGLYESSVLSSLLGCCKTVFVGGERKKESWGCCLWGGASSPSYPRTEALRHAGPGLSFRKAGLLGIHRLQSSAQLARGSMDE